MYTVCAQQVDATEESNKAIATKYQVQGFPTLKVGKVSTHSAQVHTAPLQSVSWLSWADIQEWRLGEASGLQRTS